jgi:hypothetical protein
MSITYPIDLLPGFPGWTTGFDLRWRQEQSTQASGRILVKDFGSPLWTLRATSKVLSPNNLDYWRARLTALENGLQQFRGYPMSRCFPQAYPNGSWPSGGAFLGDNAVLASIATDRKSISVSALPPGFKLSIGDYVSLAGDLHQVMEDATADVGGVTALFEVRPHIWPDRIAGDAASVMQPNCLMAIIPGSVSSDTDLTGRGSVAFQAIEARL